VEVPAHIAAVREEGALMALAVAHVGPDSAVPTCPEWNVRDLVRHIGGVHRWATGFVRGRTEPQHGDLDEVVGTWPADADLADWLAQGCADLVAALTEAPDTLQCWTFLPAPSPRAMWARRQAHETAIHRVDAQVAAGLPISPWTPGFAADGIDELLSLFVPRRSTGLRADPPVTLLVRCVDVDASWLLRLDERGVTTTQTAGNDTGDGHKDAGCTVTGQAGDLYGALWNRAGADALTIAGERAVLGRFSEGVRIRWS
jgi:uncharacterized protein (TIGR03083 family)